MLILNLCVSRLFSYLHSEWGNLLIAPDFEVKEIFGRNFNSQEKDRMTSESVFAKYLPNLRLKVKAALSQSMLWRSVHLPRPTFEGGDDKESEHGVEDVVIVEGTPLPEPLLKDWLVDVAVSEWDVFPLAGLVVVHAQVGADEELPFEKLNPDDPKHKDEEDSDGHDVADTLDGDDHALNHLLQSWSSVDGSQWTQHSEYTENFEEANAGTSEYGDERHGDDHHVENIESCATESSFVKEKTVRDELECALNGEHSREKVIKLSQNLIDFWFWL